MKQMRGEAVGTADFLREAGCDIIQGYVFSKPVPKEEFKEMPQNADGIALAE